MSNLLAKGAPDWTTLENHTLDVASMVCQFSQYLPAVSMLSGISSFCDILVFAALFHDSGKACDGFQRQLQDSMIWGYRHEIVSAYILDGLAIDDDLKKIIGRTIITHHKDMNYLKQICLAGNKRSVLAALVKRNEEDFVNKAEDRFSCEISSINSEIFKDIEEWINFAVENGWINNSIPFSFPESNEYPVEKYLSSYNNDKFNISDILMRGILIASDHFASAGIKSLRFLQKNSFDFLNQYHLMPHQMAAKQSDNDTILIAPTGSGKTEAAIAWASNCFLKNRITHFFYVLPYTASINAMYIRLSNNNCFGDNVVGMSHSKAMNALLRHYVDRYDENEAFDKAKIVNEQSRKLIYPILITTPWQLVQYFFGMKFFEIGLSFMVNCAFIIDEIHCYDAKSMGLFLGMITFLKKHFNAHFFIMSATIPSLLKQRIDNCFVQKPLTVTLGKDYLERQCRHKVVLLDGFINDYVEEIRRKLNDGKRIILVANSVISTIELYKQFPEISHKVLLHGKFTASDRAIKETILPKAALLIGTQAIEVSLDIDFDEMYTEPAPLDALLQRFGRVNRKGEKGISNVFVLRSIDDATKFIYSDEIVEKTLSVLEKISELDESMVQNLVDEVYDNFGESYENTFQSTLDNFIMMASNIRAYEWDEDAEDKFHKLFESVNVIPYCFIEKCLDLIEEKNYLAISSFMIPMTTGQFMMNHDKVEKHNGYWFINMNYDSEYGLYGKVSNFL